MLKCSRCGDAYPETLIVSKEGSYCKDCYDLEECDILYGRGGDYDAFCNIKYLLTNIHGRFCVVSEDGNLDGYICCGCNNHVYGKSTLTGYCVSCAGKLMEEMYTEEGSIKEGRFSF